MSDLDLIYGTTPKATPPPSKLKKGAQKPENQTLPTNQTTNQSSSRSVGQPTSRQMNKIVDRPKAFYITERLDDRLDKAVDYLQKKHGIKKVDRSTIVNALLDNEILWTDEALDQLVDRVVSQLTSRLIG